MDNNGYHTIRYTYVGEWIEERYESAYDTPRYRCPNCDHSRLEKTEYCPNCGADLRGRKEDDRPR